MHNAHVTLSRGGFTRGTHLITTDGPVRVEDLSADADYELYTLNTETGLCKPKPLVHVERAPYEGPSVRVETRRAALHVHPNQRIPYTTKSIERIRHHRAGALGDREAYKFANEWQMQTPHSPETIDITAFLDDYEIRLETDAHGHTVRAELPEGCEPTYRGQTGYHFDAETFETHREAIETFADGLCIVGGRNQRGRPFRFATGDFVQFIGWVITEGSTTWQAGKNTATVQIAQQKPEHRETIRALLTRMGLDFSERSNSFRLGSALYARMLEQLCGTSSGTVHLPAFVWDLDTTHLRTLFETLIAGDGNERGTYYTTSDALFEDLTQLAIRLGMKPRYTKRNGVYRFFFNETNDGFFASQHVSCEPYSGNIYRLTVEDAPVVMAGRDGAFQWCGTSRVC